MDKAQKIMITIGVFISFVFVMIGAVYGHIDYNWEIEKCSNLRTSSYSFTHDLQINANYASHCYWYTNHPAAYFVNTIGFGLLALLMSSIPWVLIFVLLNETVSDYY